MNFFFLQRNQRKWPTHTGLFYGLGVRSGKRSDSFSEIPRDELDGEECKAKDREGKRKEKCHGVNLIF